MRILLIGEFSGVNSALSSALKSQGHYVRTISSGDGWKKIKTDIHIRRFSNIKYIGDIISFIYCLFILNKFKGFDVVQFVNIFEFPFYKYSRFLYKFIIKNNKKIFYYACGTDPVFLQASKNILHFTPFSKDIPIEYKYLKSKKTESFFYWFLDNIDGIIPAMYDYAESYRNIYNKKLLNSIQLPFVNNYIDVNPVVGKDKIIIYHGLNRENFKGSDKIKSALMIIKDKYKDKIEIQVKDRVQYSEYVKIVDNADIVIDQCKTYSYGMNAILNLSKRKIVLSCSKKECMDEFGIIESPIFDISYSVKSIVNVLDEILSNYEGYHKKNLKLIPTLLEFHDSNYVCELFCKTWKI